MIKIPNAIKSKKYDEFKGLSKEDIIKKLCSAGFDNLNVLNVIYKYRLKNSPIFPHYILNLAKNNIDLMCDIVVEIWKRKHKDAEKYFLKNQNVHFSMQLKY